MVKHVAVVGLKDCDRRDTPWLAAFVLKLWISFAFSVVFSVCLFIRRIHVEVVLLAVSFASGCPFLYPPHRDLEGEGQSRVLVC